MTFLSTILSFLKSNWKLVAISLFLAGVFFYHKNAVKNAYNEGVKIERQAWKDKVKAEDEANRKYEKLVQDAVNLYGKKLLDESEKRISKETVYKNNIETIIKDNPIYSQCIVDQSIIDNRNEIRKLGPTP